MAAFADDFLFGCATSAYQIEGGIENDWSAWERAGRLKDPTTRAGQAVGHWRRWREDFELLSELGVGAYRFSIEWARVEPEDGRFDEALVLSFHGIMPDGSLTPSAMPWRPSALAPPRWVPFSPMGFCARVVNASGDAIVIELAKSG